MSEGYTDKKESAPRAFQFEYTYEGKVSKAGRVEISVDSEEKFIPESIKITDCPSDLTDKAMEIVQSYVKAKNEGITNKQDSSYAYQFSEEGAPVYEEV